MDHPLAEEWRRGCGAPSVSIAVLRNGALLHASEYGRATPQTLYQTASVGKQFTAALALMLAKSGEGPGLDSPIAHEVPELPRGWNGLTLRQLLSHTAGIPVAGYEALDFTRDYTDSEIAGAIGSGGPLDFPPGSAWSYSNAGYVLAGFVLGRATGVFYGDLLRDRIFAPLGMKTARVNAPDSPTGYVRRNGVVVPAAFVSPTLNRLADGGITLTVLDLALWEAALCGEWGAPFSEMFREIRLAGGEPCGYGLGWFLSRSERGQVAEHEGGWQGFSTAMVRYLDEGLTAIVLADAADADAARLAHELLQPTALHSMTS